MLSMDLAHSNIVEVVVGGRLFGTNDGIAILEDPDYLLGLLNAFTVTIRSEYCQDCRNGCSLVRESLKLVLGMETSTAWWS